MPLKRKALSCFQADDVLSRLGDLAAVDLVVTGPEGLHHPLGSMDGGRLRRRSRAETSIGLSPGGKSRTPDHAALVAVTQDTARQGEGGVLFEFQRMSKSAIKHVDQGF